MPCPYASPACAQLPSVCHNQPEKQITCFQKTSGKKVVFTEKRCTYVLEKSQNDAVTNVTKVTVDNCLLHDAEKKKCDFAFIVEPANALCFIELKGTDRNRAFEQIVETMEQLQCMVAKAQKVFARVVASRDPSPNVRSTHKVRLDALCKRHGGDLKVQTRNFIERVTAFQ